MPFSEICSTHTTRELTNAVNDLRIQAKMIIANNSLFTAIDLQYNNKLCALRTKRAEMSPDQYFKLIDELTEALRIALDSWKLQDTAKMLEAKQKLETFSV